MLAKPRECQGCPLYGKGSGFVPDRPVLNPEVILLTDQPTYHDEHGTEVVGYDQGIQQVHQTQPGPLLGPGGYQLNTRYLKDWDTRIGIHSVLKCRWSRTQALPPPHRLVQAVRHCTAHHLQLPQGVPVIAHGELPMWYRFGEVDQPEWKRTPTGDWRGFAKDQTFVVGHASQYFRDPRQREWADVDWTKAKAWVEGTWPVPMPSRFLVTPTTTEEAIHDWFRTIPTGLLYLDTEFAPTTRLLTLFGCGYRDAAGNLQGYQLRSADGKIPKPLKAATASAFRDYLRRGGAVAGHNIFGADLPVLRQNWSIGFEEYGQVEDSMLAHACIRSEYPHSLAFCASLYSRYGKMKHLAQESFLDYNWGDVITGLETLEACHQEFDRHPQWREVYESQSLPVARHLMETKWRGVKVNEGHVDRAFRTVDEVLIHIDRLADCYSPGINLDSPKQLMSLLYVREALPVHKGATRHPSMNADAIQSLRTWCAEMDGIDLPDPLQETWDLEDVFARIRAGEHPILICLIAHNYHDDKTRKYLKQLVMPGAIVPRIYPSIAIHTQATGRHSTTGHPQKDGGFPLAQLPPSLHDIFEPDRGTFWVSGDFKGQEIWILSAEADDLPTLEALQRGEDSHTLALCEGLGWAYPTNRQHPAEDVAWLRHQNLTRHTFKVWRDWMKRARLAMNYGKRPDYLHLIPGSSALGIDPVKGADIGTRYLSHHPALQTYWHRLDQQIRETRQVQSFTGRTRHLYGHGDAIRREGFNAPMQMGGADILNMTIVRVTTAFPHVWYVYGVHDSFVFAVPDGTCSATDIQRVAESPITINGHTVTIPVEWKPIRRC